MSAGSGAPALVLVPTPLERAALDRAGGLPHGLALVELAGFGPVASAARAASMLERLRPARVLLVGIAGILDPARFPLGTALSFGTVAIDGLGAGAGPARLGPSAMGFAQWAGASERDAVWERLSLGSDGPEIATVCAASGDPDQAALVRARHPRAVAEDMEGFAVALACALARTPCEIVRGASNVAGERDTARWRVPEALAAARALALQLLESPPPPPPCAV